MNGNGDYSTRYIGDGQQTAPSEAFWAEPGTGIYRDLSIPTNPAWTVVKNGNKRIRVDNNETYLYGTVAIDNLVPGSGGDMVSLSDGSVSSPSLNFKSDTQTGLYKISPGVLGVTCNGVQALSIDYNLTEGTVFAATTGFAVGGDSVSAPGFFWSTGPGATPGFYRPSADQIGVSLNGGLTTLFTTGGLSIVPGSTTNPSITSTSDSKTGFSFGSSVVNVSVASNIVWAWGLLNHICYVPLLLNSGTLPSAPILAFFGDSTTGIYRPSSGQFAISCGGTQSAIFRSTGLNLPAGTVSNPALIFNGGGTNTGFYSTGFGTIDIACGGISPCYFTGNAITMNSGDFIVLDNGSVGAPGLVFGDLVTGIYKPGTNQVAISTGGTQSALFTSQGISLPSGSLTQPSISYPSQTTTGFYNPASNQIAVTCSGTSVCTFTSTGVTFSQPITQPNYSLTLHQSTTISPANATATPATWDTIDQNSNFTFTTGTSTITIPFAGRYQVTYMSTWGSNVTGVRQTWISINGGTRRYASDNRNATTAGTTDACGSFIHNFVATDTLVLNLYQTSTLALGWSNTNAGTGFGELTITRLSN